MRRRAIIACALAPLAGGCGLSDPYNDRRARATASATATATARATATATAAASPVPLAGERAARRPGEALRRAALLHSAWSRRTLARQFDMLAAMSVGPAREGFLEAATQARVDPQARSDLRSSATVAAVVLRGTGNRRSALVVTREQVSGEGLAEVAPAYKVTLAAVERRADRWVIIRWSPQG